jgi:urea carboxylase
MPAAGDRPSITYRAAGDRYLMVEYGQETVDLRLNFFVMAVLGQLRQEPPSGFVEAAPGWRSILISFDPALIHRNELIERLQPPHEQASRPSAQVIPSRRITLPIAFDESATRATVGRYSTTIRPQAPNIRGGNNIDYIVECNGLPDREALYTSILSTEWWNAFTGFSPGLPFLFPLELRSGLSVPKYNPTRNWTAEGAVGLGGPCVAIYPVESSGSYQLFGRTLPIYDILGRHRVFAEDPILIRPGDRVRFTRVDEDELRELRREVFEDRYRYLIEDSTFVVADFLAAQLERRGGGTVAVNAAEAP